MGSGVIGSTIGVSSCTVGVGGTGFGVFVGAGGFGFGVFVGAGGVVAVGGTGVQVGSGAGVAGATVGNPEKTLVGVGLGARLRGFGVGVGFFGFGVGVGLAVAVATPVPPPNARLLTKNAVAPIAAISSSTPSTISVVRHGFGGAATGVTAVPARGVTARVSRTTVRRGDSAGR